LPQSTPDAIARRTHRTSRRRLAVVLVPPLRGLNGKCDGSFPGPHGPGYFLPALRA
jgi:hypothetical protein